MAHSKSSMHDSEFWADPQDHEYRQVPPKQHIRLNKNEVTKPKIQYRNYSLKVDSECSSFSHDHFKQADKQEHFTKNLNLVSYQVRIIGVSAKAEEVEDLYQEGLMTLWEILDQSQAIDWSKQNFKVSATRIINTRLRSLRRNQQKNQRNLAIFDIQDILPDTLSLEDSVNSSLNSICIQKALKNLDPDECYAIATHFEIDVALPDIQNPSPRTKKRKKRSGLVRLSKNKTVRSLLPHRFAS